jgi:aminoglycoside phosphotransferase (APT) family kinase protein
MPHRTAISPNFVNQSVQDVKHLVAAAFSGRKVARTELLSGGLINTNLKIYFESDFNPVVLRLYRDGAAACDKEFAVHNLIRRHVPVPEILHSESKGLDGSPSFAFVEYIEGITFQQLKRTNNLKAIQQASASIGKTLAAIGKFRFSAPGALMAREASSELVVGKKFIEGPDPIPRILDRFLASTTFQQRAGPKLVDRLHNFIWSYAPVLPCLETDCSLVHNDFGNRNILVREVNGVWAVAAILDWEMAFSGSSLLDVGHFLRYEPDTTPLREPYFSRAFVEHGGHLPDNWETIVRLIDLTGLVECLTHDELPSDVEAELFALIDATLTRIS